MAVEVRGNPILKRLPQKALAAEVGVLAGTLALYLLGNRPGLTLIMVDNWAPTEEQPEAYRLTRDPAAHKTLEECELSRRRAKGKVGRFGVRAKILFMPSVEAAKTIADKSLDMVFLDGDHSFEGVSSDLAAWAPKVRKGGFLGGHDFRNDDPEFDFSGVERAVRQWAGNRRIELDDDHTWFTRL